jgi:hypothetical protein
VLPPRTHWYRYFGVLVLAPNSPFRVAVTALAAPVHAAPDFEVDQRINW